jgi:hypothetical protein
LPGKIIDLSDKNMKSKSIRNNTDGMLGVSIEEWEPLLENLGSYNFDDPELDDWEWK